jgi:ribosomal protein L11 methyltransferase
LKAPALWRISVTVSPETEESVADFFLTRFGEAPATFMDARTGRTTVTVYCREKPDWSLTGLRVLRAKMREAGCESGKVGRIVLTKVRAEDWAESWKRHFKPIKIGSTLLIKPSWSALKPKKGQAVVILDPGLSFGTGQHPTTSFCLQQLASERKAGEVQSFLDLGTGSGILAIAASKIGYGPVHALDFDPESIRVAQDNARRNRVAERITLWRQDVGKLPRRSATKYSVVCANLISTLLLKERDRVVERVDNHGCLVISGILRAEFEAVRKAYEQTGIRLVKRKNEREWSSGMFQRRG